MLIFTAASGIILGVLAGLLICLHRKPRPTPPPRTAEDERAAARAKREYENFLTYDGTEQDDILL